MIFDLENSDKIQENVDCDIVIIGAGTAGLYLANKLYNSSFKIILIEEGGRQGRMSDLLGKKVINSGIQYNGASKGRSFGIGGTSSLWGGQMIPLSSFDLEDRACGMFKEWPIKFDNLKAHLNNVCNIFSLNSYKNSDSNALNKLFFPTLYNFNKCLNLRHSQWIPFKKRNFGKYFFKKIKSNDNINVWINSRIEKIIKSEGKDSYRIEKIVSKSVSGNVLTVKAKNIVICAGALESTRLLLEFDEENNNCITNKGSPLGNYFSDHFSINIGTLEPLNFYNLNKEIAPVFHKGIMCSPRLELSKKNQRRNKIPSAFIHFIFLTNGKTFFDFVRDFLRAKQDLRKISKSYSVSFVLKGFIEMYLMAFWRYFYKRLRFPQNSKILMQIDFEQFTNINSKLFLTGEVDEFNKKVLGVNWQLKNEELEGVMRLIKESISFYESSGFQDKAKLVANTQLNIDNFYDVYHPTGTIKMGDVESNSVVDSDLKLWGCDNLYVSSTAVFPSSGSANPGMIHLALTDRLALHLLEK
jgi:hypothetical protein